MLYKIFIFYKMHVCGLMIKNQSLYNCHLFAHKDDIFFVKIYSLATFKIFIV